MKLRQTHIIGLVMLAGAFVLVGGWHQQAAATTDYSNANMMDDGVFNKVNSLSETQIQAFLSGQAGPYTALGSASACLAGYQDANFHWDGTKWHYGTDPDWNTAWGSARISAAAVIYQASQMWGINPEVIISTLQKEESLVTGGTGICNDGFSYQSAMGYACPDGGGCDPKYAGFSRQVLWGSWQLEFNQERSEGNVAWDGDGDLQYVGYMTQGTFQRCASSTSCPATVFDGNAVIDGQSIHLATGATAGLYSYTPHLNQSFPGIFEGWFGSTMTPNYAWAIQSQYAYTDATKATGAVTTNMVPGQAVYVGVAVTNNGNTTWLNSGPNPIMLGTWGPQDRSSAFCDAWSYGCNRPAPMQQASVAPGQTATFEFWMKAPNAAGTYDEHFNLVATGMTWMPDQHLNFHMTVVPAVYSWQPVWQYAYTDATKTAGSVTTGLTPGREVYAGVQAKNTGNETWHSSGPNAVHLGTADPNDRNSAFCDGWPSCNRPAVLQQASVAPGQTGTFEFYMKAPNAPGNYAEHFNLVAEGITWFNDPGFNFYMSVVPAVYSWQMEWQFAYTDATKTAGAVTTGLHPGDRRYVGFLAKNTGNVTWHNNGLNPLNVGMTHPQDRYSVFYDTSWLGYNRPARLVESSVAPGQTGTFEFWLNAPSQVGTYREYFSLVSEYASWFNDPGMNFYITVVP